MEQTNYFFSNAEDRRLSKGEIAENYRQVFRASKIMETNVKRSQCENICVWGGLLKLAYMTQFITSREST
jgi:hypothetical protein